MDMPESRSEVCILFERQPTLHFSFNFADGRSYGQAPRYIFKFYGRVTIARIFRRCAVRNVYKLVYRKVCEWSYMKLCITSKSIVSCSKTQPKSEAIEFCH